MEKQDSEIRKIALKWDISSFLPNPSDGVNTQIVHEVLYSTSFRKEKDIQSYWSVPERLVDVRWLAEQMDINTHILQKSNALKFSKYIELEHGLYCVVATIGMWGGICEKNLERLKKGEGNENTEEEYWNQNESFFQKCTVPSIDGKLPIFSEEELISLYNLAKLHPSPHMIDPRKVDLKKAAEQLCKQIEQMPGTHSENDFSIVQYDTEKKRIIFKLAADFCNKTVDFYSNVLWRDGNTAILKLQELTENIRKVLPDWNPVAADTWTDEYHQSMWDGLQAVADHICALINGGETKRPISIDTMLGAVQEAVELLGDKKIQVKKSLKDYEKDGKRCVALLEVNNKLRIMAFSGFSFDCEDSQTQNALSCSFNDNTVKAFHDISKTLKADLAIFSSRVVDCVTRYKLDCTCLPINCGTLRSELSSELTSNHVSFLKKSYACCERKILAELQLRRYAQPLVATLYVKFEPCINCYSALRKWVDADSINFTLNYPALI